MTEQKQNFVKKERPMKKIFYRRINKEISPLEYGTEHSAGIDMFTRDEITFQPKEYKMIPLNVNVSMPYGFCTFLMPRSSFFKKYHLLQSNGVGLVDWDYRSNDDEVCMPAFNPTDEIVTVPKGEKIAQLFPIRYQQFILKEVDSLNYETRGGFGSTDKKKGE